MRDGLQTKQGIDQRRESYKTYLPQSAPTLNEGKHPILYSATLLCARKMIDISDPRAVECEGNHIFCLRRFHILQLTGGNVLGLNTLRVESVGSPVTKFRAYLSIR